MWIRGPSGKGIARVAIGAIILQCLLTVSWTMGAQALSPEDSFEVVAEGSYVTYTDLAFGPDDRALIVGSQGRILRYDPGPDEVLEIDTGSSPYTAVDISPTGEGLIVGDGGVAITVDPGNLTHPKEAGTTGDLMDVSWRTDGGYATVVGDGSLMRYDPDSAGPVALDGNDVDGYDTLGMGDITLVAVDWRGDGGYALVLGSDGRVFSFRGDNITELNSSAGGVTWRDVKWNGDDSKALLVGGSSEAYVFDELAGSLTPLNVSGDVDLEAVAWKDHQTAHVVGNSNGDGRILEYGGGSILEDVTPGTGAIYDRLYSIGYVPGGQRGAAVGDDVLRYPNSPPEKPRVWVDTITEDSITIGHNESNIADFGEYKYYISEEGGFTPGPSTLIGENEASYQNTHTISPLEKATNYHVIVRTYDAAGLYGESQELSTSTLDVTNPPAVTLTVTDTHYTSISVQWTGYLADDFDRYELHMCSTENFEPSEGSLVMSRDYTYTNSYKVRDLVPDRWYYFRLRTYNEAGYFSDSEEVAANTTYRDPPDPVQARTGGSTTSYVILEWTVSDAGDFDRYEIHHCTTAEFTPSGSTFLAEDTYRGSGTGYPKDRRIYYSDLGDEDGTYYFKVRVIDEYGQHADSEAVSFIYNAPPPDVISIEVQDCDKDSCDIGWSTAGMDRPEDFDHFVIYRQEGITSSWKEVAKVEDWNVDEYTVTGLEQDTRYKFKIVVVDESGTESPGRATETEWTADDPLAILSGAGCICPGTFFGGFLLISAMAALYQKGGMKYILWGFPAILALVVVGGSMAAASIFEIDMPTWYHMPVLAICMGLSAALGVGPFAYQKYRERRWREAERKRSREMMFQSFRNHRDATRIRLERMESKLGEMRDHVPLDMVDPAMRRLEEARSRFSHVSGMEHEGTLQEVDHRLGDVERRILDMEAFLVARRQARGQLRGLGARIGDLRKKKAPRLDVAYDAYVSVKRELDEADHLEDVRDVIEEMKVLNGLIDEAETGLKGAREQYAELLEQVDFLKQRVREIEERCPEKEGAALRSLRVLVSDLESLTRKIKERPDLDLLSVSREKVRDGKRIIMSVDERQRKREVILSDLESLAAETRDLKDQTTADLSSAKEHLEEAGKHLGSDRLDKARRHLGEASAELEGIRRNKHPELVLPETSYRMQLRRWEELDVHVGNHGEAMAKNIEIEVKGPDVRVQEIEEVDRSTFTIKPGEEIKVPIPVQFTAEGAVPIKVTVEYTDLLERSYRAGRSFKVHVVPKGRKEMGDRDLSPRKTLKELGLKVVKRGGIHQGFYKFKVSIQNEGEYVVRDVDLRLIYDGRIFRLHHIYPREYDLTGDSVRYGDIEPGRTVSVEFYLEAHMCTETALDGVITFKDVNGKVQTQSIGQHRETFVCPSFVDVEQITPAQVKEMVNDSGWRKDTWTYALPSTLDPQYSFDLMKEAIEKFDPNLTHVFDETLEPSFCKEAWYYGEAEGAKKGRGIKHVVIGRVRKTEEAGTLNIIGASPHKGQLFALSSRLGAIARETISKKAKLSRPIKQIFQTLHIQDSVIQRSNLAMGTGGCEPSETDGGVETGDDDHGASIRDSVVLRSDVTTGAGRTEIDGSVVQRSKVGGDGGGRRTMTETRMGREFDHQTYKAVLKQVWEDGIVETHERDRLKDLRAKLNIGMEEHFEMEEEVLEELGAKEE